MDLEAHINYLADTHGMKQLSGAEAEHYRLMEALERGSLIPFVYCNSFSGTTNKGEKVFYIDPDETDDPIIKYFVGLHEIGHQVLGHQNSIEKDEGVVLANEIAAWEWALEHSVVEPTDDVYVMIMVSVGTYSDSFYMTGAWGSCNCEKCKAKKAIGRKRINDN